MKVYLDGEEITVNGEIFPANSKSDSNPNLPPSIFFWHHLKVNDEVRGYIVQRDSEWEFISCYSYENYFLSLPKNGTYKIVKVALILESPHIDEYSTNYMPIRPANGQTGQRIEEHIVEKIEELLGLSSGTIYQIYIMNPVQYQSSCYHELQRYGNNEKQLSLRTSYGAKKCRNDVWKALFSRLKKDFIHRLLSYQPNYILNACTGGTYEGKSQNDLDNQLNYIVEQALQSIISEDNYYRLEHPSVWK